MICQAEAASSLKVMDIHHNEKIFFFKSVSKIIKCNSQKIYRASFKKLI